MKKKTNNLISNAYGLGFVIYMEKEKYTDNIEDNKKIHININKTAVIEEIINKFKLKVLYWIIGHEHGNEHYKCHYQIAFKTEIYYDQIKPDTIEIDNQKLLLMSQSSRNIYALIEYCKKEGDYEEQYIYIDNNNIYSNILNNNNLTHEEIISKLNRDESNAEKLLYFGNNLFKFYDQHIKKENIPDFQWNFPKHLLTILDKPDINDPEQKWAIINKMYEWFKYNCIENNQRKQGLFLYTPNRGLGKTYFAKNLVNNPQYYIYCRGTLDGREFKEKPNARLLIFDDVEYVKKDKEMWKAFISGEECNVRTPYYNVKFNGNLPCIILTNSKFFFDSWINDIEFCTQCIFIGFNFYLGPIGTRPKFLTNINMLIADNI